MPNVSVFDGLSTDEIARIEAEIANRNFKDYSGLSEWCKSHGWSIERGALWNRGKGIKQRLQTLRDATDMSKMIGESVKDEGGSLNDATLSLVQAGLFNIANKMIDNMNNEDDDENNEANLAKNLELFTKAAKASSELGRASIAVKKYKAEVQVKLDAAFARLELQAAGGKPGVRKLDADTLKAVRQEVYGLV